MRFAVGLLLNRKSTAYLEFPHLGEVAVDHDINVLYFNSCKLADAGISYSARGTLTATSGSVRTYQSTAFTLLDAGLPSVISTSMERNKSLSTASTS